MALLQMQDMLYTEAKAKGRIREPRWYSVEFLSSNFILAALVLCLELPFEREGDSKEAQNSWQNGCQSTTGVGVGSS